MSGRGGAGNFYAAEEARKRREADLEAANRTPQTPTSPSPQQTTTPNTTQKPVVPSNINQDYAHMGRGGSGNWYEPKVLAETGQFSAPEAPESLKPIRADKEVVTDTRRRGRGGAGNFVWDEDEEGQVESVKEIELKEMVVRDVEAQLPRPPRVVQKTEKVDRAFVRDWED